MYQFSRFRVRIISVTMLLVAGLLVVRLVFLQIIQHERYLDLAKRQYVSVAGDRMVRGSIFFTAKDGTQVAAATTQSGFKLALVPKEIIDREDVYQKLNAILPLDYDDFIKKAEKKDDPYEEIMDQLTQEQADQIQNLGLEGVRIYQSTWRWYPGNALAAQVVGFLGYGDDNQFVGRYGLERYYHDTLSGKVDALYVNFFAQIFSGLRTDEDRDRQANIITTIEPSVQQFIEKKILDIEQKWQSEETGAIVLDPVTGKIIAMASLPTFDVNDFRSVSDISVFSNPLVERVYEMGSIMKPVIVASALDSGSLQSEDVFYDAGSIQVNDRTIYNFDKQGRGDVSVTRILSESLNTGMVQIVQNMNKKILHQYLTSLGIGKKTSIDLPGEVSGLVKNLESYRDVEYANVSFGQGIAVTPIAMVRALSALANNGKVITPYVVEKISYGYNKEIETEHSPAEQVLRPQTVTDVTDMLVEVVDHVLDGGKSALPYYSVATKTGTAQIPHPSGGYYDDRNLHSFFGYFPAYQPRFLVFFYTVYPKQVRYASQTLFPPFMETADFLINYYQIPPDREPLNL